MLLQSQRWDVGKGKITAGQTRPPKCNWDNDIEECNPEEFSTGSGAGKINMMGSSASKLRPLILPIPHKALIN